MISEETDGEVSALNAALLVLQERGAVRRCLEMVVKRATELSKESSTRLDAYFKQFEVPGYRLGKAPPLRVIASRESRFERRLFRRLIRFWMELYAGLPETVVDAARRAVPEVDFASADWATIAEATPAIAARLPRNPPEDILLALFAFRFRSAFDRPHGSGCQCEHHDSHAETETGQTKATTPPRVGDPRPTPAAPEQAEKSILFVEVAPSPVQTSSPPQLGSEAAAFESKLDAIITELHTLAPGSEFWDEPAAGLLRRLAALRDGKLNARASEAPRMELERTLGVLRVNGLRDELVFLRVREECDQWTASIPTLDETPALGAQVRALIASVEAHRSARIGAQTAANDTDLETCLARRREAKQTLLALIAELSPRLHNSTPPHPPPSAAPSGLQSRTSDRSTAASEHGSTGSSPPIANTLSEAAPIGLATSEEPPESAATSTSPGASGLRDKEEGNGRSKPSVLPASVDGAAKVEPAVAEKALPPSQKLEGPRGLLNGSTPASTPTGLSATEGLPLELSTFHAFQAHYWVGSTLTVEAAPWCATTFAADVKTALLAALDRGPARSWELLVMARALEALDLPSPVAIADIKAAAAIWANPGSESAGLDATRGLRLRSAVEEGVSSRFTLLLEALRPSPDHLQPHEISSVVGRADFESGALRVVVERFLSLRAQGHEPLPLLQALSSAPTRSPRETSAMLADARKELQNLVTRVWSAAGGKIQRTHCRKAWREFIDRIQPFLMRLYPPPRGDDRWTEAQALKEVGEYEGVLEGICETYSALFDDKRRMLRTAAEIADAARVVVALRREESAAVTGARPPLPLPDLELGQLRQTRLREPDEEFGRLLLLQTLRPLQGSAALHPLAITLADVCARPELLRGLGELPDSPDAFHQPDGAVAYADDLLEPVRAAAILLRPAAAANPGKGLDRLVSTLDELHRGELLCFVVHVLDERLQRRVHSNRTDALGRLAQRVSLVSKDVQDLSQLGNHFAVHIRAIRDDARDVIEAGNERLETRLAEDWLDRVHEASRRLIAEHAQNLMEEASSRENSEEIRSALAQGQFGRAIRMLRGHAGQDLRATRQTDWRDDAAAEKEGLQKKLEATSDPKIKALVDAWRVGVKGDSVRADRTLRTEFVRLVTAGKDLDRASVPAYVAIPMAAINADLTRDQLMPTWMPQLSRFGRLVVLTPPFSPEQPNFRQEALVRAAEFPQDLVVFLAPRLSATRRDEVLTEIRRRGTAAALVDDLDLLRLLNPGGERPHLMLGLLEIVLEQQRRAAFSPFDLPEGSHVRLEMYVGRRDQARELARSANYSRLFSGRKLGKSALLRFIERTEGGMALPSGNVLRVVYVPAVGVESEAAMVDAILTSLEGELGTRFDRRIDTDPSDKLGGLLKGYLDGHKKESLLVVLDEADVFVERQFAEYDERRERCLSFQMRSRFNALTDEQGLPRVRFVFAGYRVTNRSQGAWANWGRVLSLDPLDPEDAARLIAAPLSVMGIDIASHAHEIAYRCGYQPAILLRFGERLMEHLERQPHPSGRQVVGPADVADVLDDQRVHEEIRTITRNNFEGHPVALIVFGALLREFLEVPPGQPVRDAPRRILERLRRLDPDNSDTSWLERDGDGSATVRGLLVDFVERSLLRERRSGGEAAYSLRFPHHLTVLASLADEARMREDVRRLRVRSEKGADHAERALISQRVLRDLSDASQPLSGAIGVLGTLWPAGSYDKSGGVPDRLGVTGDETVDASELLDGRRALSGVRAVRRVDVPAAAQLIAELSKAEVRPTLIGGVDLLRWAIEMRRSSQDLLFEVHGVGRASVQRVAWWFQRVRGLEFMGTDAIERIHKRTGGIPLLLDVVDSQLATAAGTTVADSRVSLALAAVDEATPRIARGLTDGRPSMRLEAREREILQMVRCVVRADQSAGQALPSALTELWELFAETCPFAPLSGADADALEVLLESGLLPTKASSSPGEILERVGPVAPTDPVLAIVDAIFPDGAPR